MLYTAIIIAAIAVAAVVGILIGGYYQDLSWRMSHEIGDAWACILFAVPAVIFCVLYLLCRIIGALRALCKKAMPQ